MATILPSKLVGKSLRFLSSRQCKNIASSCPFSDHVKTYERNQHTLCNQEGEDKKNDIYYSQLLKILKDTKTHDFLTHCSESVSSERATAIKIMSLMQLPPGVDFQQTMEVLDWWTKLKATEELEDQAYDEERVHLHGPDSTAAHFFLERQASIRLKDGDEWMIGGLPTLKRCVQGYFVNAERGERDYLIEAVDCKNFHNSGICYEGLQYLTKLNFLKYLSLENQTNIDAFCLDRIAGQNGDTLEYLNITGCELDTGCIIALSKMRALKELVVTEPASFDVKSDLILLKKSKPGLTVRIMDNYRKGGRASTRSAPRPVVYHPRVSRGQTPSPTDLKRPFDDIL